jgi:hypothetical protein
MAHKMGAFDATSTSVGIPIYRTVTESRVQFCRTRSLRACCRLKRDRQFVRGNEPGRRPFEKGP